jgi:hypothetical protein
LRMGQAKITLCVRGIYGHLIPHTCHPLPN